MVTYKINIVTVLLVAKRNCESEQIITMYEKTKQQGLQNWQLETSRLNKIDVLVQHYRAIVQRWVFKYSHTIHRCNFRSCPKVA